MTKAFFDYNPVGPSLYVLQEEGKEPRETTVTTPDGATMVEAITGFMATENVEELYCNKAAMGLESALRQRLLTEYNNTTIKIYQYE